jgi:F-type H+-transporting ATPase subunit b
LLTDAGESAERDKERLIAAASGEAEAIGATASRDLDTQVARSRRALQAHVADQAISIAKKILQDNFSADDQRRLVREHLDSLGETVA